jgi:hypothetical protein
MGGEIIGGLNISMLTILLVNYNDNKSSTLEILFPRKETRRMLARLVCSSMINAPNCHWFQFN